MGQSYVGEIRMFGGNFAPVGWAFCDGQLIPISENETLFQLLGTTYGGDGQETFALPNLQGRIPIHVGAGHVLGENAGTSTVTLTVNQIPNHPHSFLASTATGGAALPTGNSLASNSTVPIYKAQSPTAAMGAGSIGPAGGSQPHDNMMQYLVVSFIISLFGVFPTQS